MLQWNQLNILDQIRLSQGPNRLRRIFHSLFAQSREKALLYINNNNLMFPSLFILIPELEASNSYDKLNERNIAALKLCTNNEKSSLTSAELERLTEKDRQILQSTLKWMFETGTDWDGLKADYDQYDAIMDTAAALLIKIYSDHSILPSVVKLIFRRNRKDLYIHDLVWSFFQAYDPDALKYVAEYLASFNEKDVKLACKILHLNAPDRNDAASKQKLYHNFLGWLDENRSYLYMTGEHFQYSSDPNPVRVDLDAKYLNKSIMPRRKSAPVLTSEDKSLLEPFHSATLEDQNILAAYSQIIHDRDRGSWEEWKQRKLAEQIQSAKQGLGVN